MRIINTRLLATLLTTAALQGTTPAMGQAMPDSTPVEATTITEVAPETPAAPEAAEQSSSKKSSSTRYTRLTEADFRKVARELGVDVAAIKAVCAVEAGHQGFVSPGKATINFDLSVFKNMLAKRGISQATARKQAPIAFASVNTRRYGSYGKAQYARLNDACNVDRSIALQSTFWGLFQIGGFNYRQCGCKSIEEFVALNNESELQQLELFGRFITRVDLLKYLRAHNWRAFARGYNGPRAVTSYSSRLAAAYRRYK